MSVIVTACMVVAAIGLALAGSYATLRLMLNRIDRWLEPDSTPREAEKEAGRNG